MEFTTMANIIHYTGIGSRKTPENILKLCTNIAENLAELGCILRSGGAEGCDTAFELGCDNKDGLKEIYLPWRNFNNNKSNLYYLPQQSYVIAKRFHPNYSKLSDSSIKLIARDGQEILGQDLMLKSNIVIFYAPVDKNSNVLGGTGQAIRIAKANKIPCINLLDYNKLSVKQIIEIIKERMLI